MALPKLNESPKYELVIPSTQEIVHFRPYLVKEEKILMLAAETGDAKASMSAVVDTLKACIQEDIAYSELTTFDIEYAFIQVRSKSVGEFSTIRAKCTECNGATEVQVPLDDINVDIPVVDKVINLTDTISVSLKWPHYLDILAADLENKTTTEQTFTLLMECIDEVMTDDEVIKFKEESEKDRLDFLESLDSKQFMALREFVEQMPSVAHELEFGCSHCGHENKIELKGMQDFL